MKYVGENALKKWTSLVKSDIKKKLDKNQGTANSGKILGVDVSGEVAPTDTEVATLVDVPNGIVKGDGSTLSAAVAGTDYMVPPTGGTTGQVLTKTEDGQEWADASKSLPTGGTAGQILTKTTDGSEWKSLPNASTGAKGITYLVDSYTRTDTDKAVTPRALNEVYKKQYSADNPPPYPVTSVNGKTGAVTVPSVNVPSTTSLLKGNGNGGISSATAGTDYVAPNGDGSNITAAFTAANTRANIATGEKLSVLLGKIAKWFADLGSLAFKSKVAKSDLASDVQSSLGKADSALQSVSKSDVGLGNVANERQYSSENPPPYPVTSVNGKTGAVTVETSSGTTYNATLSSSGWTTSGSYKKQTITVTGLKANYPVAPVVDAQLTGTDADGDTAVLTGFSAINLIQTAANQLIAYCIGDAPTVNIPLIINTWG